MPLRLTDDELDAVYAAARPIAVQARDAFLQALAQNLSSAGELGPGSLYRVIRETQRQFFDPPELTNTGGRCGATSKFG
jgi:hypothetical protein